MNTRKILNKSTFLKLPPEYQYKLSLLLPAVDRHGGKLNYSSFNNEFFARACEEWQERLFSGDFTPENLTKAKADIESDKLETDPWKIQNFEPVWGIKKGFDQDQKEKNTEIEETIFTDKNEAALLIQSTFRGYKQRKEYQRVYGMIVLLQSMTRKFLAQKRVNSIKQLKTKMENRQRQQAAIIIQRCFRSFKVFRDMQRNQAALVIQAAVHRWMVRLKLAREEKRRKASALLLQRVLQGWTVRRHFLEQKRAATLIKAAWKGYKLRMALKKEAIAKQLAVVQRRVSEAHKNATEDQKLCNRTAFALDYLYTYKDMAMLIKSLNNLNITLRYSTNCCLRLFEAEAKALSILMDILNGLNRSVPHLEVMSIILDILISLAEYEETRSKLVGIDLVFPSVIATMGKGEKNAQVFGKGCSLLWRLASTKKGQSHLREDRIFKKLKEFDDTQNRLKRRTQSASQLTRLPLTKIVKKVALTTKHGCQLTENIVRFHTDPHVAINGLMKRLSKCT